MGKLADVDVLIEAIEKKRVFVFPNEDPAEVLQRQGKAIRQAIEEAPAVDAAPVVRGRWMSWEEAENCVESPYRHECSVCHDSAQVLINGLELLSDYCPNCGAKMDKED